MCGDVFETNQVDRKTVARALECLGAIGVPVLLLPGNHDPLDASSVFRSPTFRERKPAHVLVLDSDAPIEIRPGVEVIGAPWTSKKPLRDLCASVCAELSPAPPGTLRILVGHGAVDALTPDLENPALIRTGAVEVALADGRIHYLALGDRHSVTAVGTSQRIGYAGTPEATDYDEDKPGYALIVDVTPDRAQVIERAIGTWRFLRERFELSTDAELDAFESRLFAIDRKESTILKLSLVGTLTLEQKARLDDVLERARDLFAAIEISERASELVTRAADSDFEGLELSGFGRAALDRLRALAAREDEHAPIARDALALLVRLAGRRA